MNKEKTEVTQYTRGTDWSWMPEGYQSGVSPPGSQHVVGKGGSFATVEDGSGKRQLERGLGGQGFGWGGADCAGSA